VKDSYDILDLPLSASQDEIRARYKQLVRIYHPDRFSNPLDKLYAERKLKEINEAYESVTATLSGFVQSGVSHAAPVLSVEPLVLDFGVLRPGDRQVRRFQVDNHGGMARSINFVCSEEDGWFHVTNGRRVHQDQPLPLEFEVVADVNFPVHATQFGGWIEINMDGIKKRVALSARAGEPHVWRALPRLVLVVALCLAALLGVYIVRSLPAPTSFVDAFGLSSPAPSSGAVWASTSQEDEDMAPMLRPNDAPFAQGASVQPPAPPLDENARAASPEGAAPQWPVVGRAVLTGPISSTAVLLTTPLVSATATLSSLQDITATAQVTSVVEPGPTVTPATSLFATATTGRPPTSSLAIAADPGAKTASPTATHLPGATATLAKTPGSTATDTAMARTTLDQVNTRMMTPQALMRGAASSELAGAVTITTTPTVSPTSTATMTPATST
jgi:hypothetical protein